MAQHDYVIANGTGAAVRSDLNNGLSAIVTQNSGATEPATTYAFMRWADTTAGVMKMRNSANNAWITLYQLDGEWTNIAFENGTAAAPSIYFKDSGTDTGFYSPGANQVGISTGGTARLTIDSNGNVDIDSNTLYVDATNNRVGLGTSAPQTLLHLQQSATAAVGPDLRLTNNAGTASDKARISFYGGTSSPTVRAAYDFNVNASGVGEFIWSSGENSLTERMRLDASGRLGIGTALPSEALTVGSGNVQITGGQLAIGSLGSSGLQFINNGTIGTVDSIPLILRTATTERARIDTSGRLLVGTSTARSAFFNTTSYTPKLQIEGTTYSDSMSSLVANGTGIEPFFILGRTRGTSLGGTTIVNNGDTCGVVSFQGSDGTELVEAASITVQVDGTPGANDMPGRLVFSTTADGASSPTEHMRIDNAGNLMVRTTTSGTTNTEGFNVTYAGGSTYSTWGHKNGTSAGQPWCVFSYNGGSIGSITQNGTTGASFNTTSDYRLKENIVPLTGAAARLSQIPVHRFNFIADPDRIVDGFIAHEAQAVVPECVTGEKDAVDADGNPVYQGIDQSKLVPLLTAALQEALAEIESLKARVTALEP